MKKKIIGLIIIILLLIAFGATVTIEWLYDTFGHLSIDEIIFHLKVPMEGTNTDIIFIFLKECLLKVIVPTGILSFILIYPMVRNIKFIDDKIHTSEKRRIVVLSFSIAILILGMSIKKIVDTTDIIQYIQSQLDDSHFIENEYINPQNVDIKFGEEKRNLIYIYLESMESTYYSIENGGLSEKSLIPEIEKLAKENINFSSSEKLRGAYTLYGTTWTVGAMSAQTLGVPLKLSIEQNALSEYSVFLRGGYGIGEILEKNGYHNFLLLGSEAVFGGRKNLFEQHGNYEIWDFESAMSENRITEKIWWGYNDELLFEFAKEKLLYLSSQDEPFNFTMLTADTHFPDGYLCDKCLNLWDEQYKNVISCSSRQVYDFIKWIQKQDFYENTTIVIMGDHLTMQSNFFTLQEGQEYDKTVVSIVINPAIETEYENDRIFSTFDMFPTTLAVLGAKIEGDRLALGTNLFSEEKTLLERYGIEYVNNELMKTSKFYNTKILVSN